MLEASLYISEHLPDGATGLWGVVHCATWVALGELEWIPFAVLRKSIDINLLGKWKAQKLIFVSSFEEKSEKAQKLQKSQGKRFH